MSPRFPRPTVSVRNILFKSFGGGRSPFYLTLPLLQRSNACIIAQTMSNCFSFSIFQCFFRCLLVDCRGSQFFFRHSFVRSPRFLTCFWIFHIVCIHFALSVSGWCPYICYAKRPQSAPFSTIFPHFSANMRWVVHNTYISIYICVRAFAIFQAN